MNVETLNPANTFAPIGPYSHLAKTGPFITVSGTPGVNSETGDFLGPDVFSQTLQIIRNFRVFLAAANADLSHVMHIQVFLKNVADFAEMNRAYAQEMGELQPARTVICVADLPKVGALLTMNLFAINPQA